MNYNAPETISKKINVQVRMCAHLQTQNKDVALQRAMVYLKLKTDGCSRKAAMGFAAKRVCRSDCTLKLDGPSEHRKLKVQHKHEGLTINGWLNSEPQYSMGSRFRNGVQEITKETDEIERTIGKDVKKLVDGQKLEYHKKVNHLHEFIEAEEQKTNLTSLSRPEILRKVRSNREQFGISLKNREPEHPEAAKKPYNPLGADIGETRRVYKQVLKLSSYVNKISKENFVEGSELAEVEVRRPDNAGSNLVNAFMLSKWKDLKGTPRLSR